MSSTTEQDRLINRREAIGRVSALLGGVALIGGSTLLAACDREQPRAAATANGTDRFTPEEVAFLDEVADTILPTTKTPGAKAAQTGAFMALMVTDGYDARDQQIFRDGMRKVEEATQRAHQVGFMQATPQQRLAVLETLDREQKAHMDARAAAAARSATEPAEQPPEAKQAEKNLQGDPRQQAAIGSGAVNPAPAITADAPPHYFRMMKELALLGYFTSEIGYTKAMRYVETPGRCDPCVPYTEGEPAWAPHA
ncbi:MAG: gluconate 2-dehydrogenase subunit 3 family protein [Gemmatirosa sp.]